ncbi:MAG: GtrA family protein [Xanthobacteraceae bacterium]
MAERNRSASLLSRAVPMLQKRADVMRKAISFALIGLINTTVDATVFFVVYAYLTSSAPVIRFFAAAAGLCRCGAAEDLALIAANVTSWLVAMTFSYVMNSTITFAAESGRKLRFKAYGAFAASGVLGVIANTATLVLAAQVLPVWAAKGCAILVSFVVNFSMSHFVVFRPKRPDVSA